MEILLVGAGGILGGIARYHIGSVLPKSKITTYIIAVLIINITGALMLGIVSGVQIKNSAYLFLGDGFFGAYTTFSTFMYEGFNLFKKNKKLNALIYILGSFILGVAAFACGYKIAGML